MEHNAIESFVQFCDEMMITQEGKIFDKIKSKFIKDKKDEKRKTAGKSSGKNIKETSPEIEDTPSPEIIEKKKKDL